MADSPESIPIPPPAPARRVPAWLFYSLVSALCWGLWGFLSKCLSARISPSLTHILTTQGAFAMLPLLLLSKREAAPAPAAGRGARGFALAMASGLLGSGGNILYYRALEMGGLASVVTPLATLYPVVTIALAVFVLKERIRPAQAIGLALAITAIFLLSLQKNEKEGEISFTAVLGQGWLYLAGLSLLLWGHSAWLQKVASNFVSPGRSYAAFCCGYLATALALLLNPDRWTEAFALREDLLGFSSGSLNGLGVLSIFAALGGGGKASVVVPLAALYPIITLALAVPFLGERPSSPQLAGAVIAVMAGVLLGRSKT